MLIIVRYPVLGVLEDLNATAHVLEERLPTFFAGFARIYETELKGGGQAL